MSRQLNVDQMEKIVARLPLVGNGDWLLRQNVRSVVNVETGAIATSVSPVAVICPGDKLVGHIDDIGALIPFGSAPYWAIRAMEEAGWVIGEVES